MVVFDLRVSLAVGLIVLLAPLQADAGWIPSGTMSTARSQAVSAMSRGRWVIAGGSFRTDRGVLYPTQVDVLDVAPGGAHLEVSGAPFPPLSRGRGLMAAATAPSGAILVSGGVAIQSGFLRPVADADVWTGTSWLATQMLTARSAHAATFASGMFVVSGGWAANGTGLRATEVLSSQYWEPASDLRGDARVYHSLTTLTDDRHVLAAGGCDPTGGGGEGIRESELFDAVERTWRRTGSMRRGRCTHQAVRLTDGRIMVTGGDIGFEITSSVETFDPAAETWTETASMLEPRARHGIVALPDGRIVVAGGTRDAVHGEEGALSSVELYDPEMNAWTALPPMRVPRWYPTMTVAVGSIYVAGGINAAGALATIERLPLPTKQVDEANGCRCHTSAQPTSQSGDMGSAALLWLTFRLLRRRRRKVAQSS